MLMVGFHGTLADFAPRHLRGSPGRPAAAAAAGSSPGPARVWVFTTRRAAREWARARGGYSQRYRVLRVEYRDSERNRVGQMRGERIVHPDDVVSVRTVESGTCGLD